ncbi:Hsp20 family protein [Alistipes sp. ZOR0009]|uniref:Hsp20 family protein n=1 Tax=Alistipes sp. ZOR0009 TaxID=1339253 RepID=UPI00064862F5|nr:Hsp20 family protein [Alistipes sp. ZOR0009]
MLQISRNGSIIPKFLSDLMVASYANIFEDKPLSDIPAVSLQEDELRYTYELLVLGLKKSDLRLCLTDGVLEIAVADGVAIKAEEELKEQLDYSNFTRSFLLPEDADLNSIKATCVDGVLRIFILKKGKDQKDVIR